jgi:pepF/M3 family oligoendopeptidase
MAPAAEATELPRWDLTPLFPSLASPEFAAGFAALLADMDALQALFDMLGVRGGEPMAADRALVEKLEQALSALNDVERRLELMAAYLYGQVTVDSRDETAQARYSQLQERSIRLSKLHSRFTAWVGAMPIDDVIAQSPLAAAHAFPLRKRCLEASHLMSEEQEALAAELAPSSGTAWGRLHGNLTSQIVVPLEIDGEARQLPMSEVRNLAMTPDRTLRERAWRAELAAWEGNALPIAAALNGVKGQVLALGARRDWLDPLDEALFVNAIDREILDAMIGAARESLPDFRRYLRLKAKALGVPELAWYDLFAPVGDVGRSWSWPEAAAFIEEQFGAFGERMKGLARRAFTDRWVDAGPRPGKVGGAYCMRFVDDQSRILANYSSSYDGVSTLAHELGHAYHNLTQEGLSPLQRQTPMILAETASTFCETIVKEAALVDAAPGERQYILEQSLQGACQIVVDILSRFDFERALFAARRERELSSRELCRLMLEAQAGTYGDGLAADARHPYMWAVKGHYYSPDLSYYNFPYLFGLLFGLGLYAIYQREPRTFPDRYDALLAATVLASAPALAAEFGIDLRDSAFWRASLDVIRADIDRFA